MIPRPTPENLGHVRMADEIMANECAAAPALDTIPYYDHTEPDGDDWIYFQKIESR
jgi:hypothetical protein